MAETSYIHGTTASEQDRLRRLNDLTNGPFVAFLSLREGERVLEVGSGLGYLAAEVAEHVGAGEVMGIEYSAAQLAHAQSLGARVRFVQGDAHQLPFADESFDLVYCRYVLEHVADPLAVLCEMRRVLRPGGRVRVQENDISVNVFEPECPTFDRLWSQFVVLQARLGGDALVGRRLFQLFQAAGLREIELSIQSEVHWSGSAGFVPWVQNLLENVTGATESFISQGLATRDEITAVERELRSFMSRPDASAHFYWNRAAGVK